MFSSELCWHRGISKLWYSITLPPRTESSFFALSTEKGHVRSYWRSHLTPSPYVRTNPRSVRFSYDRRRFPAVLDVKAGYPILTRRSIALSRTRACEEIKFRRSEIPSSRTPRCRALWLGSRPSSTRRTVHNSSSAFAGAGRPRQKTFSFSFRERSKESHNRAILAM